MFGTPRAPGAGASAICAAEPSGVLVTTAHRVVDLADRASEARSDGVVGGDDQPRRRGDGGRCGSWRAGSAPSFSRR